MKKVLTLIFIFFLSQQKGICQTCPDTISVIVNNPSCSCFMGSITFHVVEPSCLYCQPVNHRFHYTIYNSQGTLLFPNGTESYCSTGTCYNMPPDQYSIQAWITCFPNGNIIYGPVNFDITITAPPPGTLTATAKSSKTSCTGGKITGNVTGYCGSTATIDLFRIINNQSYYYTSYNMQSSPGSFHFYNLPSGVFKFGWGSECDPTVIDTFTIANCAKPINPNSTNVLSTSAKLNWTTQTCGIGYKVQYRVQGTTHWTTKNVTTNTGFYNATGLTHNTTYEWHVKTKCAANPNQFSGYASLQTFTTALRLENPANEISFNNSTVSDISIFPNPATNKIELDVSDFDRVTNVKIYNIFGQELNSVALNLNGEEIIPLEISSYAPGIYQVIVVGASEIGVGRFVKQ